MQITKINNKTPTTDIIFLYFLAYNNAKKIKYAFKGDEVEKGRSPFSRGS